MTYNKKTIEDISVKGKKVIARCDFNVPMKDGGGCAVIFTKEKPSAAETIEFAEHELIEEDETFSCQAPNHSIR